MIRYWCFESVVTLNFFTVLLRILAFFINLATLGLETDISRLEAKINKIKEDQKNLEKEEDELKLEIEEANGLVDKYEKQQMAVRNNREYDALTKEIESQKQKVYGS